MVDHFDGRATVFAIRASNPAGNHWSERVGQFAGTGGTRWDSCRWLFAEGFTLG